MNSIPSCNLTAEPVIDHHDVAHPRRESPRGVPLTDARRQRVNHPSCSTRVPLVYTTSESKRFLPYSSVHQPRYATWVEQFLNRGCPGRGSTDAHRLSTVSRTDDARQVVRIIEHEYPAVPRCFLKLDHSVREFVQFVCCAVHLFPRELFAFDGGQEVLQTVADHVASRDGLRSLFEVRDEIERPIHGRSDADARRRWIIQEAFEWCFSPLDGGFSLIHP